MAPLDRLQYVSVGAGGVFSTSGAYRSEPKDVDDFVASVKASGERRVAIHFHGGLVPEHAGAAVVEKMIGVFARAGSRGYGVIWETGLGETLRDNLRDVARTALFRELVRLALKLASKHVAGGVGGRGPGAGLTEAELDEGLASPRPFASWDTPAPAAAGAKGAFPLDEETLAAEAEEELAGRPTLAATLEADLASTRAVDARAVLAAPPAPGQRGIVSLAKLAVSAAKVVVRVVRRMLSGHGHGFYPTVVEETLRQILVADFGEMVWGAMKRKAGDMFAGGVAGPPRAGAYLVERLAQFQQSTPGFIVDVVGHSAGAIAVARLLPCAQSAGLRVRRIGLLAPAVRADVFETEVIARDGTGFDALRTWTMADRFESADRLAWLLYPRSLLYFISGVLEGEDADTPIVGLERQLGGAPPYAEGVAARVGAYLRAPGRNRLVLARSSELAPGAPEGFRTDAAHHGDFDDDAPTQESVAAFLRA